MTNVSKRATWQVMKGYRACVQAKASRWPKPMCKAITNLAPKPHLLFA
jgi:hypothetical protein